MKYRVTQAPEYLMSRSGNVQEITQSANGATERIRLAEPLRDLHRRSEVGERRHLQRGQVIDLTDAVIRVLLQECFEHLSGSWRLLLEE